MSQEEVNVKSKLNRRQRYLQLVAAGIMAVLVVAVAWLAYAYTELNQSNARLQEEVTNLKTKATPSPDKPTVPTPNPTPAPEPADNHYKPDAATLENIKAIFETMNTQPIEGYLANSVTLYQNSATPWKTTGNKTEVALSLDMLGGHSQRWNFNLSESEINRLKSQAGFEKLFGGGCLTGRTAAGSSIVSLCFSKDGKIHSILMCNKPSIFTN
mgnify:FL=1